MTATQILTRMAEAYATCFSYSDTGVVSTRFIKTNGTRIVEKPFTTAFIRPDRFRFEYQENGDRHFAWREGTTVRVEWLKPGMTKILETMPHYQQLMYPESLAMALAGMTGVSGSSAHTIPTLLLPDEIGGRRLTDMTEVCRREDALLEGEGEECYLVAGSYSGHPTVVWIEKATFCVRRIEAQHPFEGFRTETTTMYFPAINGAIDKDLLCYNRSHA
jgi:hypothetical protein